MVVPNVSLEKQVDGSNESHLVYELLGPLRRLNRCRRGNTLTDLVLNSAENVTIGDLTSADSEWKTVGRSNSKGSP